MQNILNDHLKEQNQKIRFKTSRVLKIPFLSVSYVSQELTKRSRMVAEVGSNHRPRAYESRALTN